MDFVQPTVLELNGIRLEPLTLAHEKGLQEACKDGELWKIRVTSTPHYTEVKDYIKNALAQQARGERFAFAVVNTKTNEVLGTTGYHDILVAPKRLEVGYTWYAKKAQRTYVNTTCKLLLLTHAFETLKANVVGFRADQFNFASQKAIERLGATKDGVIRGNLVRKDGTIRDAVIYSIVQGNWQNVKAHIQDLLTRY